MKLTLNQIQQLYKFTRQHYVEHYDLQTELVDHLAHGIEQLQQENPSLSFEQALNQEFKKFGVFGFMDVVAERQKTMSKKYYGIIFKFFKEYFQLPKIILTLCLTTLLVIVLQTVHQGHLHYWVSGILLIGILPMFISILKHSKKLKKKKRKWMLEEMLLNHAGVAQILILPIHLLNFEYMITSFFWLSIISFTMVSMLLLVYVITFVIPSKAEKLLEETYPEYKMT
jgi:hypothetical protein